MKRQKASDKGYTVVVAGGAGAMGSITVRDLFETAPSNTRIVIADYNGKAARTLAARYRSKRVTAATLDVQNVAATTRLLRGAFAVVCAVQYQYNVKVMEAAWRARVHYLDLGGLFHVTRKQLTWHRRFAAIDRLALLGIGAAPGITNLLARWGAEKLDRVDEMAIYVGGVDHTPMADTEGFGTSYSIQTILEEASKPAAVFRKGRFAFVPPMSEAVEVRFPSPIGTQRPHVTLHSEVATLPLSFRRQGVRDVSFRIAFDAETTARLRFLHTLGLTSTRGLRVDGASVVPMHVLLALLKSVPKPRPAGPPQQVEVLRAVVTGHKAGKKMGHVLDCHVRGMPQWGMGIDIDTGCPPSIAVQLLATGVITARGALPAEKAVPLLPFFHALKERGMMCRSRRL